MKQLLFFAMLALITTPLDLQAVLQERYGGNVRVAAELLGTAGQVEFVENVDGAILPRAPVSVSIEESVAEIEFAPLSAEQQSEIQAFLRNVQTASHPCHWILDYPHTAHVHRTKLFWRENRLTIETEEPEYAAAILSASCMFSGISALQCFRRTQYGLEANAGCLSGRPFLDSISPVEIDPINPYLSFKLNDVDVIPVVEERFQQLNADPELSLLPAQKYYVFLKTTHLTTEQLLLLTSALNVKELAATVLNDHAELLFNNPDSPLAASPGAASPVFFRMPAVDSYRLLAERIKLQLQDAGFPFTASVPSAGAPLIEVAVVPMREADDDVFYYRLLREVFKTETSGPWFDYWDELQSEGRIIPLLIHHSYVGVRKTIIGLRSGKDGRLNFSDCWLKP